MDVIRHPSSLIRREAHSVAITMSDASGSRRSLRPDATVTSAGPQEREQELGRVCVVGHLTIDDIRLPDGTTLPGTTGGAAAYAALGGFLAQGEVAVLARVGEDYPVDRLVLEHPDGGRIRTDDITVVPGRSIHNVAHYGADGSRYIDIESFDVMTEQTPVPGDLAGRDVTGLWVLVAPATLPQQEAIVDTLRAGGALIALDTELHYLTQDGSVDRLRELARRVDCFLPSLEHLSFVEGSALDADSPALQRSVESFGCPSTVVKCGSRGVVLFGPEDAATAVRAVPDLVVADPTGAGDAFNGGFLVGLARGERPRAAAVTGCVAASFAVQAVGAAVPESFSTSERSRRHASCSVPDSATTERQSLAAHQPR